MPLIYQQHDSEVKKRSLLFKTLINDFDLIQKFNSPKKLIGHYTLLKFLLVKKLNKC